jgi:flagellar FliL protein
MRKEGKMTNGSGWTVRGWLLALLSALVVPMSGRAETGATLEYINLTPAFIANYGGPGPIHFLKTDIALRLAPDPAAEPAVQHHMPYIRHVLVMLLSRQTSEALATMEGKEKLRQDALAAVRGVLEQEEGRPYVDDLLFNSFIVQR